MLAIYLFLLVISLAAIWVVFNDDDEVHNLAAVSAGLIALVWFFVLIPLPMKMLLTLILLIIYQQLYATDQKL
ncbi:MAG: hypothetical protein SAL07_17025 [Oscillatoria sp. PMC 1051.18]|uniref:hypothetical protein n=1 Tax=Oscillatoria salina TaxID=331517 RepID=UPI0013BC6B99|nr:hypothetical protein [Oscillatoria salina]MBZ8181674.1 xanthine/uracil/vitamin C permease [Oscillatoria salina IIICB1]MEC4894980.1 hypothetical protein [Oscillatoria sp. PMC 1050.18]MEC5031604.1 hypothetical protein [Oscillatoria sp. PMC 1051.18]NET90677.1 xanthine/uracil/vitamin C permease [Kamptonema sp. SIO1D9]